MQVEAEHSKSSEKFKLKGNLLSVTESKSVPDEAISTTYHLSQCLLRRGLALDFANLIGFEVYQTYCKK